MKKYKVRFTAEYEIEADSITEVNENFTNIIKPSLAEGRDITCIQITLSK